MNGEKPPHSKACALPEKTRSERRALRGLGGRTPFVPSNAGRSDSRRVSISAHRRAAGSGTASHFACHHSLAPNSLAQFFLLPPPPIPGKRQTGKGVSQPTRPRPSHRISSSVDLKNARHYKNRAIEFNTYFRAIPRQSPTRNEFQKRIATPPPAAAPHDLDTISSPPIFA